MGKGGGRGSGAGTGVAGAGPGGRALERAAAVARKVGVLASEYMREGMRSLASIREAFRGATPSQANAIAAGRAPSRSTGKPLEPITVAVSGKQVTLRDGRHRLAAAVEAGAREIRAKVVTSYRGKSVSREMVLPIHGRR